MLFFEVSNISNILPCHVGVKEAIYQSPIYSRLISGPSDRSWHRYFEPIGVALNWFDSDSFSHLPDTVLNIDPPNEKCHQMTFHDVTVSREIKLHIVNIGSLTVKCQGLLIHVIFCRGAKRRYLPLENGIV